MEIATQSYTQTIPHILANIEIRPDGHVNATKLCQVMRKEWKHYNSNAKTKDFLKILSEFTHLPVHTTIKKGLIENGSSRTKHTWVHPDVAIHLAQWISAHVAVAVVGMIRQFAAERPDQVIHQMTEALQKTMRESGSRTQGYIYILQTELVPSRVKIGFSHQNFAALRERYRTAFPDKTTIWAVQVSNAPEAEAGIHSFFDEFREAGEWFEGDRMDNYLEYLSSVHGGEILQWKDGGF